MFTLVPNYYKNFRCIADKCDHTCCAGWEIDIDDESLEKYQGWPGSFGEKLRANISLEETPHFILKPGDRCPFLQDDGLCEMILSIGEENLCQICTDHPRFRNFWTDMIEMGIGMSCKEAARLILSSKEALSLEILPNKNPGEDSGIDLRAFIKTLPEDEQYLIEFRNGLLGNAELIFEEPLKRLYEYLVFRHIADALYDDMLNERLAFVDWAFASISDQWTDGKLSSLVEIAAAFSEKYEYNPELQKSVMESLL